MRRAGRATDRRPGPGERRSGPGERRQGSAPTTRPRVDAPPLPDEAQPELLDHDVRKDLRSLPTGLAEVVARHLVAAAMFLDDDPALALAHGRAAASLAARLPATREAAGIAAYHAGEYATALVELRTARRMDGSPRYLPMIADAERGLGRPERAIDYLTDPSVAELDPAGHAELLMVGSGARRDLGQPEAAAVLLQDEATRPGPPRPWTARLRYAYAEALLDAGRPADALRAFEAAAAIDEDGETDADDRVYQLLTGQPADAEAAPQAEDAASPEPAVMEPEPPAVTEPEPPAAAEPELPVAPAVETAHVPAGPGSVAAPADRPDDDRSTAGDASGAGTEGDADSAVAPVRAVADAEVPSVDAPAAGAQAPAGDVPDGARATDEALPADDDELADASEAAHGDAADEAGHTGKTADGEASAATSAGRDAVPAAAIGKGVVPVLFDDGSTSLALLGGHEPATDGADEVPPAPARPVGGLPDLSVLFSDLGLREIPIAERRPLGRGNGPATEIPTAEAQDDDAGE